MPAHVSTQSLMNAQNQFSFQPYRLFAGNNPLVAAIDLGRRLQRFYFHLVQGWLLADDRGGRGECFRTDANGRFVRLTIPVTSVVEQRWLCHQRQFHLAKQTGDQVPGILYRLSVPNPGRLNRSAGPLLEELLDSPFPDRCYDTFREVLADYEQYVCDQLRKEIIECNVDPYFSRLCELIREHLPGEEQRLFDVGNELESGICPPEAYQFLSSPDALGGPSCLQLECAEPTTFDSIRFDIEPGQLQPAAQWCSRIRGAWHRAALSAADVRVIFDRSSSPLIERVEKCYTRTCQSIAGTVATSRLSVDVSRSEIRFDGKCHQVDQSAAILFRELAKRPEMAFTEIKAQHPEVFGKHDRLDRLLCGLPDELRSLVVSAKGTPARLVIPQ